LVFKLLKGVCQHRKLVSTEQPTEGELAISDEELNAVEDELEILAILRMPTFPSWTRLLHHPSRCG
jgi:hypothetical protein